jgi:hypothetical protein
VLVSPDVFVVPLEQARTLDWSRMHDLMLVAEILIGCADQRTQAAGAVSHRHDAPEPGRALHTSR